MLTNALCPCHRNLASDFTGDWKPAAHAHFRSTAVRWGEYGNMHRNRARLKTSIHVYLSIVFSAMPGSGRYHTSGLERAGAERPGFGAVVQPRISLCGGEHGDGGVSLRFALRSVWDIRIISYQQAHLHSRRAPRPSATIQLIRWFARKS